MTCKGRSLLIFVAVGIACATEGTAQGIDLKAVVALFYPQSLDAELVQVGFPEAVGERRQCHAVLESDGQGNPETVVAAYANVFSGAVRVLRRSGSNYFVADEATDDLFVGEFCEIEAVDVDGDGKPEAIVRFLNNPSTLDWVYAWRNSTLVNIGPTSAVSQTSQADTELFGVRVVDLNGDGIKELASFRSPSMNLETPPPPVRLFRLTQGAFAFDKSVITLRSFERKEGNPETRTTTVRLPTNAVGPFTMRVINGAGVSGTGNRVESAAESGRIWLNGQQIIGPNDFGNQVAAIERSLTLQPTNELSVRLAGTPGGRITILIEAASWAQ
jgi:hypothetical protein